MAQRGYHPPTSSELYERQARREAERRLDALATERGAAGLIGELDERIASLTSKHEASEEERLRLKARNANLKDENQRLRDEVRQLKKKNSRLSWDVEVAHSYSRELECELKKTEKRRFDWAQAARSLAGKVKSLRSELRASKAKLARNPQNSSLPPSSDPNNKKVFNSRERSGKRPGGQPGHPGHGRRLHDADATVMLPGPDACPCGGHLVPTGNMRRRQLTDLVITTTTTDYISEERACLACNNTVWPEFPDGVGNEANYGDGLRATCVFLVNSCNVSIDHLIGFLDEATGGALKLSKGSAHNFLAGFTKKAAGEIKDLKGQVSASRVVCSDATHTRSEGKKSYVLVFTTKDAAVFEASGCKGTAPLATSPLADFDGTVVHDHDLSYYGFGARHAECNVHVMRYAKGVVEMECDKAWAACMRGLLAEASAAAKSARAQGATAVEEGLASDIGSRFDAIIAQAKSEYEEEELLPAKYRPEGIPLYRRLEKFKDNHLLFLHDTSVPFDNNASERQLRAVKGKLKQSGGFKSTDHGEAYYCDYLSIAQSARLRDMPALGTIRRIFNGDVGVFAKPYAPVPDAADT